jgi:hypothetical protein
MPHCIFENFAAGSMKNIKLSLGSTLSDLIVQRR